MYTFIALDVATAREVNRKDTPQEMRKLRGWSLLILSLLRKRGRTEARPVC